ncbi:hypothetical protein GALMADRAFT_454642 [Galerina marginata CBS 339.88]|uniref:Uncharacterized protein n=1 Tax=Galerina marginata (strain CBS 339.88) TaxID=685588 RepID=A0A067TA78_GALM3|nr:hypothetical protein GALMADRAFT_454642 [Galerina marginata CBS 339.88]
MYTHAVCTADDGDGDYPDEWSGGNRVVSKWVLSESKHHPRRGAQPKIKSLLVALVNACTCSRACTPLASTCHPPLITCVLLPSRLPRLPRPAKLTTHGNIRPCIPTRSSNLPCSEVIVISNDVRRRLDAGSSIGVIDRTRSKNSTSGRAKPHTCGYNIVDGPFLDSRAQVQHGEKRR